MFGYASIMSTPITREPHLVSRVVLRAWADGRGELLQFDVRTGKRRRSGPGGFGYTRGVDLTDVPEFEARWHEFENAWRATRSLVEGTSTVPDEGALAILRDAIAVHMARTHDLVVVHAATTRRAIEESVDSVAHDPVLAPSYRDRFGVDLPDSDEGRRAGARRMLEAAAADIGASAFMAESILDAYAEARRIVDNKGVEIIDAADGEFLIGDAPAQTVAGDLVSIGPLDGVSWAEATSIWMPIGRRHAIALSNENVRYTIDHDGVDRLNAAQVRAAHAHVGWHPDAGLEAFAAAERERRPSARLPIFPFGTTFDIARFGPEAG